MQGQQRQFETQLRQLREEAQRNIDFRYKAERDLDRARETTQRDRLRPHMAELGQALSQQPTAVRRSMLLGEFEKMYFRRNERQEVMGDPSRLSAQVPVDFLRKQRDQRNPAQATIVMPINFEGSTSLKAESVFVSMNDPVVARMPSQISSHQPSHVSSSMQLPGLSVHLSKQDTLRMSSQKLSHQLSHQLSGQQPLRQLSG